jgi:hypothetical protein
MPDAPNAAPAPAAPVAPAAEILAPTGVVAPDAPAAPVAEPSGERTGGAFKGLLREKFEAARAAAAADAGNGADAGVNADGGAGSGSDDDDDDDDDAGADGGAGADDGEGGDGDAVDDSPEGGAAKPSTAAVVKTSRFALVDAAGEAQAVEWPEGIALKLTPADGRSVEVKSFHELADLAVRGMELRTVVARKGTELHELRRSHTQAMLEAEQVFEDTLLDALFNDELAEKLRAEL